MSAATRRTSSATPTPSPAPGHDLNGTRFPLFIKITDLLVPNNSSRIWYQPLLFYLLAADFLIFPVSEWSARLPTA